MKYNSCNMHIGSSVFWKMHNSFISLNTIPINLSLSKHIHTVHTHTDTNTHTLKYNDTIFLIILRQILYFLFVSEFILNTQSLRMELKYGGKRGHFKYTVMRASIWFIAEYMISLFKLVESLLFLLRYKAGKCDCYL